MSQGVLFDTEEGQDDVRDKRSGTFIDNMQLPVHRWYRYSAGFSADWTGQLIGESACGGKLRVLDPFAGSGTVVLEAERSGVECIGVEAHPFIARVARAKLSWRESSTIFQKAAAKIANAACKSNGAIDDYGDLIAKCYPTETLQKLDALKKAWQTLDDGSALSELCWLTLVSILRVASPVGTAQWQYILPKKTKAKSVEPIWAYVQRAGLFAADMVSWQAKVFGPPGRVLCSDARTCEGVPDEWADLVVTSPPYANNYDYADATRLEMMFLGEINGWSDLQAAVRTHLVRSCTQHVAPYAAKIQEVLADSQLLSIGKELRATCSLLEVEKANHGGKKQYDAMIAHYFLDMARVWKALRRATRPGGRVCFVVGDSAPYGIHVPVDRWLGELAVAAGFKTFSFEKLRDRNTKWKNRKHRVLLHEGRLWVEG